MSESYRELGGGIADPAERPECSWNCDGMGLDQYADIRTRGFVECPVHRPRQTGQHRTRRSRRSSLYR